MQVSHVFENSMKERDSVSFTLLRQCAYWYSKCSNTSEICTVYTKIETQNEIEDKMSAWDQGGKMGKRRCGELQPCEWIQYAAVSFT